MLLKKIKSYFNCIKTEFCIADSRVIAGFALLFLLFGILSSALGGSSLFYSYIRLPKSSPSKFFIVIMWCLCYIMLGASCGFVSQNTLYGFRADKFRALLLCSIMMCFNLIWYPLFFGARALFLSFIDALIVCVMLSLFALFTRKLSKSAFALLIIPLFWNFYCLILNFSVIILN